MTATVRGPVAVMLSRFPLITETFILREIIELERQGQPVLLVPMIRERAAVVHEEAKPWMLRALFTPWISIAIARSVLRALVTKPDTVLSLLWWIVRGSAIHPATLLRSLLLFPKAVHLAERLSAAGVEHVHAHFATHPATMAYIVNALAGISFSFTVHAHDIFVDRSLLREKVRSAAFARAISTFNRRFLESLYPAEAGRKIEVIHVGVEPEKYASTPVRPAEGEDPRLVCIAALKPYKGVVYLVEACRRLVDEGLSLQCDIIGVGPLRGSIRRAIVRGGLHDRVRLRGALPQHEVAKVLRDADLFVLPSIIAADGQMEGIPVALMEAMASGKPVISTSISGIPELVEDGVSGLLVDPGNVRHLADAIRRALHDPSIRTLAMQGREKVAREFDLRRCTGALVALFDRHNPQPDRQVVASVRAVAQEAAAYGVRATSRSADALVVDVSTTGGAQAPDFVVKRHLSRRDESRPPAERAQDEWRILTRLANHFAEANGLGAPRPLRLEGDTISMTRVAGIPLSTLIRTARAADDATTLRAASRRVGVWLETFQLLEEHDGLPAVHILAEKGRRNASIIGASPRVSARLTDLERELAQRKPRAVARHGDFWPGNIFVDGQRVEVIDFEGYGISLAAFDMTYFLLHASLHFALRRQELMACVREGFFEGYGRPLDKSELALCRLVTSLQLAAKDTSSLPLVQRVAIRRVVRAELRR